MQARCHCDLPATSSRSKRARRRVLGDQVLQHGLELVAGAYRQRGDEAAAVAVGDQQSSGGQRSFRRLLVEAADVAEDLDRRAEDLAEEEETVS